MGHMLSKETNLLPQKVVADQGLHGFTEYSIKHLNKIEKKYHQTLLKLERVSTYQCKWFKNKDSCLYYFQIV